MQYLRVGSFDLDWRIVRLPREHMKNKEPTETVKIDRLAKTVREMIPKLKKKHGEREIDFQVVIKNGRVALKPVVK